MDWVEAIVYGVVQGATEYLPISSSAHLALVPWIMGWQKPSLAFDILVQLGTLGAVVVYLRKDVARICGAWLRGVVAKKPFDDPEARKGWYLIIATMPAVVLGLLIKDFVEQAFGDPRQVLIELFITGVLLALAELIARRRTSAQLTAATSLLVGCGQALAILPGISRSGATIAVARALGMEREEAGRFSFLMSIPVMLAAGIIGLADLATRPGLIEQEGPPLVVAFLVSAGVGFLVIRWFLGYLRRHNLYGFALYCCVVASVGLVAMSIN